MLNEIRNLITRRRALNLDELRFTIEACTKDKTQRAALVELIAAIPDGGRDAALSACAVVAYLMRTGTLGTYSGLLLADVIRLQWRGGERYAE